MPRPIIVLGMHRSGTSLIAELVDKWGAFGGDEFLPADSRNPRGYWEYAPLVHFNRRLLANLASQSFVPPSDRDQESLRIRASQQPWRDGALRLVAAMVTEKVTWYWKDPRLGVSLGFWQQFWDRPVYVIAVREPLDTALSLKKRDNLPLTAGLLLWQRYMTAILRSTETWPDRIFVQYERVLSSPRDECRRLCEFLDELYRPDNVGAGNERVDSMLGSVNPKLQSNSSDGAFFTAPEVSEGQKKLYRYLQAKTQDRSELLDPMAFEMPAAWRDYLETLATLEQLRTAVAAEEQALLTKIRRKISPPRPVESLPW